MPGTVVETNGTKSEDGKSVTWSAGWKDVKEGKVVRTVTFKGEGLTLKPFHVRLNGEGKAEDVTKAAPTETPKEPAPAPAPAPKEPETMPK